MRGVCKSPLISGGTRNAQRPFWSSDAFLIYCCVTTLQQAQRLKPAHIYYLTAPWVLGVGTAWRRALCLGSHNLLELHSHLEPEVYFQAPSGCWQNSVPWGSGERFLISAFIKASHMALPTISPPLPPLPSSGQQQNIECF